MSVINLDDSPPDTPLEDPPSYASANIDNPGPTSDEPAPSDRPPRDFALSAFQSPEKLDTLVSALQQHDVMTELSKIPAVLVLDKSGSLYNSKMWKNLSIPGTPRSRSRSSTTSLETIKPSGSKRIKGENASNSSTERDEPKDEIPSGPNSASGLGLGPIGPESKAGEVEALGASKKKSKKKNKKKKKSKSGTDNKDEDEVEGLLEGDDDINESIGELGVAVDDEITIELGGDSEGGGMEYESPDLGDVSQETIAPYILITPGPPNIPLPRTLSDIPYDDTAKQASETSTDTQATASTVGDNEVTVRLPAGNAKERRKAKKFERRITKKSQKEEEEAKLAAIEGQRAALEEDKENMPTNPAAQVVAEQCPPLIMVDDTADDKDDELDQALGALFARSSSPPPLNTIPEEPGTSIDINVSYPLARAWTLHYSYTGTPLLAAGQASRIVSTPAPGVIGVIPPPATSKSKVAEEYSHGLVRLYTATTVEDLLGSWKSLRRAIAYKKGRAIEPPLVPVPEGMEGLGIGFLPDDTNFHFFLQHVKPMWEDELCRQGGKIMFTGNPAQMDALFFQVVLLLAGGEFDDMTPTPTGFASTIVGAVLSKRKQHTRLEIWVGGREPLDNKWIKHVEQYLQEKFPAFKIFDYRPFKEAGGRRREGAGAGVVESKGRLGGGIPMGRSASAGLIGIR